ncbi:MAG: hypothetical protein H6721_12370 [Sandaracinus sp.]|nr:hypothetical protein [Sandaracinus sp.]
MPKKPAQLTREQALALAWVRVAAALRNEPRSAQRRAQLKLAKELAPEAFKTLRKGE